MTSVKFILSAAALSLPLAICSIPASAGYAHRATTGLNTTNNNTTNNMSNGMADQADPGMAAPMPMKKMKKKHHMKTM